MMNEDLARQLQQQNLLMQQMSEQLRRSDEERQELQQRLVSQEQRLQAMAQAQSFQAQQPQAAAASTMPMEAIVAALQAQSEGIAKLLNSADRRPTLIDTKGLGKPHNFNGKETDKFLPWSIKTRNYVLGVFPELRPVLEWAEERDAAIQQADIDEAFGHAADDLERVPDIEVLNGQLYTVLTQLTEGEPFDITRNAGEGQGFEAWRRITRRYDPSTGGRKRNLLNQILKMSRSSLDKLSADIERWEDLVRNYERRKGASGDRLTLQDDIKCSVLEAMCPEQLEQHIQMNRHRLLNYAAVRQEVASYLETKTGAILNRGGQSRRNEDDMDTSSFQKGNGKGGKGGGGKPPKKHHDGGGDKPRDKAVECYNCGKKGHIKRDCWSKGGGQASASPHGAGRGGGRGGGKADPKGRGGGKPKGGGRGKGHGLKSLEEGQEPEKEDQSNLDALDLCAFDAKKCGSWMSPPIMFEGKSFRCVKCNLDTGAAITAIPCGLADGLKRTEPNGGWYKTASGEVVPDEGGARLIGFDDHGVRRGMHGRVAPVHKPLVSGTAAARTQDLWLGNDGGYLLPRDGPICRALRDQFELLVEKHGFQGLTPVYIDKGVYCFDLYVDEDAQTGKAVDVAPFSEGGAGSSSEQPGFPRQAQQQQQP